MQQQIQQQIQQQYKTSATTTTTLQGQHQEVNGSTDLQYTEGLIARLEYDLAQQRQQIVELEVDVGGFEELDLKNNLKTNNYF